MRLGWRCSVQAIAISGLSSSASGNIDPAQRWQQIRVREREACMLGVSNQYAAVQACNVVLQYLSKSTCRPCSGLPGAKVDTTLRRVFHSLS